MSATRGSNRQTLAVRAALGGVAQLGERLLCTQKVVGSIPVASTNARPPDLG